MQEDLSLLKNDLMSFGTHSVQSEEASSPSADVYDARFYIIKAK